VLFRSLINFTAGGCDSSVVNCDKQASLRVSFIISLPNEINNSLLFLELENTTINAKHTFVVKIPDGTCNCENECFVQKLEKQDKIYVTVILNQLIEGDKYVLRSCIDYIDYELL
jgi:alkyl sulfatase BDS1-like metallo-beta-lactamase superfamily hydrolase